ncbi:hypothetical protein LOZ65_006606 [Ophidiomyces ophidiicola]|nr:hypothetical protein LOZ65_006606 [Ophidiomyces ophidiicola]
MAAVAGTRPGKPIVVGLYGVPGSGKSNLLKRLELALGQDVFAFFEGSKVIADIVPGGLDAFVKLGEEDKACWRERAIDSIKKKCADAGKVGVVAGHFMFWSENSSTGTVVCTSRDLDTFTHILYLDVPVNVVAHRRSQDAERSRPDVSVLHLEQWQQAEKSQLRHSCRIHGILFMLLSAHQVAIDNVAALLNNFQRYNEKYNLSCAEKKLDDIMSTRHGLETMLVLDADKTLAAEDASTLFWQTSSAHRKSGEECPLKLLFSSPLGYSYTAFQQATLLYEEATDDRLFETICQEAASAISIYPEFKNLLNRLADNKHVGAVVVTCGLRRAWEIVLERAGLSRSVSVIGGGRLTDGFVVTPTVKGAVIDRLRNIYQLHVWAFGDSPMDLSMLRKADQAVVVVGDKYSRSRSMESALMHAIDAEGLQARQLLLPSTVCPRLDLVRLPLINLTDSEVINLIFRHYDKPSGLQVLHATDKSMAKLLMTPMRDAANAGPMLRGAHRRAGRFLATDLVADLIGLEEFPIRHVQGNQTNGHRLLHEKDTLIVPLMRGGEPMALGVHDAFPLAMFLHAHDPTDISSDHLRGKNTIILVDSVVNSGRSILEFVHHIRAVHPTIRLVVVAGVVQVSAVSAEGSLTKALGADKHFSIVALRLSGNKFTGKGSTDTGNRLFNTVDLMAH